MRYKWRRAKDKKKQRHFSVALQWFHFAIASLCINTTSLYGNYVSSKKPLCKYLMNTVIYFHFYFSLSPIFTNLQAIIFLDDKLYWEISPIITDF